MDYSCHSYSFVSYTLINTYNSIFFRYDFVNSVLYRKLKWHLGKTGEKLSTIQPPQEANYFKIYFFSFTPLYHIFFLLCSIAALGTRGYFYCGCILYVVVGSDVLHTILTAVRRSGKLLLLYLVIVCINYKAIILMLTSVLLLTTSFIPILFLFSLSTSFCAIVGIGNSTHLFCVVISGAE